MLKVHKCAKLSSLPRFVKNVVINAAGLFPTMRSLFIVQVRSVIGCNLLRAFMRYFYMISPTRARVLAQKSEEATAPLLATSLTLYLLLINLSPVFVVS